MPSTQLSEKFKTDVLNGAVNFAGVSPKTYKMLLIKPGATGVYDQTLLNVGTPGTGTPSPTNVGTDEASGTGYTSGGFTMTGVSVSLAGSTGIVDWSTNPNWPASTISAICAVLYEAASGDVVGVFDFGGTVSSTNGTFTVTLPASGASTSLVRVA